MSSMPPIDPYQVLGVEKDASLAEIRSAHRKLVLRCHPDKVHDPSLKAIKQNEFQQVQEAYEILSDGNRRQAYDHRIRVMELKKEAAKGRKPAENSVYEFEVKTTGDRHGYQKSTVKVYAYSTSYSKSHEELYKGERRSTAKKPSNVDADRRRSAPKEYIQKKSTHSKKFAVDEEKARVEKEAKREKQRTREKKEKERKRGSEETRSRKMYAYFEDASDDDYRSPSPTPPPRATEKSSRKSKSEEEPILREEASTANKPRRASSAEAQTRRSSKEDILDDKWIEHQVYAGAYMQAAKKKGTLPGDIKIAPSNVRRAESYAAPSTSSYNIRFTKTAAPIFSDEDPSRRPTKKKEKKSPTEAPSDRKKSKDSGSSPLHPGDAHEFFAAEQPSTPAPGRKPSLQKYASAPPFREKVSSTTAHGFSRGSGPIPPVSRAQTYPETRGHHRKPEVLSDSESDLPHPQSYRHTVKTSYSLDNGRTTTAKTSRHRAEHYPADPFLHGRSLSPQTRPATSRKPSVSDYPSFRRSSQLPGFPPEPDPSARTACPQSFPQVVTGQRISFNNPNYSPSFSFSDVVFANHSPQTSGPQNYGQGSYPVPGNSKRNFAYAM